MHEHIYRIYGGFRPTASMVGGKTAGCTEHIDTWADSEYPHRCPGHCIAHTSIALVARCALPAIRSGSVSVRHSFLSF